MRCIYKQVEAQLSLGFELNIFIFDLTERIHVQLGHKFQRFGRKSSNRLSTAYNNRKLYSAYGLRNSLKFSSAKATRNHIAFDTLAPNLTMNLSPLSTFVKYRLSTGCGQYD